MIDDLIPTFTDITTWEKNLYASTGGTRSKKIYFKPENNEQYFFKGSKKLKDGSFKYPSEFWSEITSSKIGAFLGFRLLDYNIGYDENDEQQIGCLSKSMIDHSQNKLAEGVDFLRGFKPAYDPKLNEDEYTLEFIIDALKYFNLSKSLNNFIEMMVFDACIGNSDRHQENWGFITYYKEAIEIYNQEIKSSKNLFERLLIKFIIWTVSFTSKDDRIHKSALKGSSSIAPTLFAPIYDSGCSLGRENEYDRLTKLLSDEKMLEAYLVNKSKSEIRWEKGKKPSHFELLKKIKKVYPEGFSEAQEKIGSNYSLGSLSDLIQGIDQELPIELRKFKLIDLRKDFMIKAVALRVEKILEL
ncbi:MAG: hypothetical protein ABJN36_18220 [Cyclobacteriaceae bacterium]